MNRHDLQPVPVRVNNSYLKPEDLGESDEQLVAEAKTVTADITIAALIQTFSEPPDEVAASALLQALPEYPNIGALAVRLRNGLINRIRVARHGWGSWEAVLAVPPDAVIWAAHEILVPVGAAIAVRLGETRVQDIARRILDRLRHGAIDTGLIEATHAERRFELDVWLPGAVISVRRESIRTTRRAHSAQKAALAGRSRAQTLRQKRKGKRGRTR